MLCCFEFVVLFVFLCRYGGLLVVVVCLGSLALVCAVVVLGVFVLGLVVLVLGVVVLVGRGVRSWSGPWFLWLVVLGLWWVVLEGVVDGCW